MKIAVVAYDGFTDVDLFLPWDLFFRVTDRHYAGYEGAWEVAICADQPRIASYSGIEIERHQPVEWCQDADGVFVVSGNGCRAKLKDDAFLQAFRLDPGRQIIAAIDSGALLLARQGLLEGLSATTYPSVFGELERMGVRTERSAMVVHGNVATGGGCLASADLAGWMVGRLIGEEFARSIVESIARVEP